VIDDATKIRTCPECHSDASIHQCSAPDVKPSLTIAGLVAESYGTSKSKGWHDPGTDATVGDRLMLMVSEISEALECFRDGDPLDRIYFMGENENDKGEAAIDYRDDTPATTKPLGFPTELADVLIRVGDFCGKHGIDLERALRIKMAFNKTRPHRHGGKKI
jgi:hypothetical protein